ncbi:hypothetical protein [Pseudomonas akapageensis]|uniref:hypothetical protein n=1 Tax=Pseudomonas akapageensis TaxID=2609961 RepID=UPI00140CC227|nr:hypothetical protein [Pseudomonas akapageensis]
MSELDLKFPVMSRRGFFQACVLLSVGGYVFGLPRVAARPSVDKPEFVLVNGWVLPAHYFRNERA